MKEYLHKIEVAVDKTIPYSLILLFFLIIGQIFFYNEIGPYHFYVSVIDGAIIFIFILDLAFKYVRIKSFPRFFRRYWLEIIAVFPAFLVLRVVEEFVAIANVGETIQTSFHEALEIEKESKKNRAGNELGDTRRMKCGSGKIQKKTDEAQSNKSID